MSDNWIEKTIVNAILKIVEKRISEASFDRTIKAIIKSKRTDEDLIGKGSYIVKYQDTLFIAYSANIDTFYSYKQGDQVLVLIPNNDWSQQKFILSKCFH